jgi:hypothetical protein
MLVVSLDPAAKCADHLKRAAPFLQPEAFFFEGADHALRVGIALGMVITCQRLVETQGAAGLPKGHSGRLTVVIAHQRQPPTSGAIRKLPVDSPIQSRQPVSGRALATSLGADHCCGRPVEHPHAREPAEVPAQDVGHVDTPPFVGLGGFGFPSSGRPLRSQALIGGD